jgi:hypothetical protein
MLVQVLADNYALKSAANSSGAVHLRVRAQHFKAQ